MSFKMKATGFGDLDKNLRKIILSLGAEQSSIAQAIKEAVDETIIPVARSNVYSQFDTSGELPDAIVSTKVNQYQVDIEVQAPHGAIHEFGGTFEVTEKQRAFFWHMFMSEGDEKWKALALSDSYTMPARPYLQPAIDQELDECLERVAGKLGVYWSTVVGSVPMPPAQTTKVTVSHGIGFC